eukprot:7449586-Alexandrium_andersonii.AAC.1
MHSLLALRCILRIPTTRAPDVELRSAGSASGRAPAPATMPSAAIRPPVPPAVGSGTPGRCVRPA